MTRTGALPSKASGFANILPEEMSYDYDKEIQCGHRPREEVAHFFVQRTGSNERTAGGGLHPVARTSHQSSEGGWRDLASQGGTQAGRLPLQVPCRRRVA